MKRFSSHEITVAAAVLKQDGCIAVATDTVYGVCARMSEAGQQALFEVKHRPVSKQFPVMCLDEAQLMELAEVTDTARIVIHRFMPGPMTVILKRKESLPLYVSGGGETIAVRLATSEQLRQLIRETGSPLFMSSANQSGQPECSTMEQIEAACPLLDAILEGTPSFGKASTIVDCTHDDVHVLREGPVTAEEIQYELRRKNK
ncbi:MAG: threonylcarbamoyl-AMP synthase [Solobacterium sp.]|nr:threonylcarbamoyl-AMP synthase [Solobacterium sp.]